MQEIIFIIILIIAIFSIGNIFLRPNDREVKFALKKILDDYYKENVLERYPCSLLIEVKQKAEFDGAIYDFSLYDDQEIIGVTLYYKNYKPSLKIDEEGKTGIKLLPSQEVCLMKDGNYQWDFRRFISQ